MPTSQMPAHLTKVSYILLKTDKPKLERAAARADQSMSDVISHALRAFGVKVTKPKQRKKAK